MKVKGYDYANCPSDRPIGLITKGTVFSGEIANYGPMVFVRTFNGVVSLAPEVGCHTWTMGASTSLKIKNYRELKAVELVVEPK